MSYGTFRAELIGRVLGEHLTPRQVGDLLAERTRQNRLEKGANLAEISALYAAGEDWLAADRAMIGLYPWNMEKSPPHEEPR